MSATVQSRVANPWRSGQARVTVNVEPAPDGKLCSGNHRWRAEATVFLNSKAFCQLHAASYLRELVCEETRSNPGKPQRTEKNIC